MTEITVEFLKRDQSLAALQEAAYRLIGDASCKIESSETAYLCHLTPAAAQRPRHADVRSRLLDLVTDENLRETIAVKTESTRTLILALAFGALADAADRNDAA